ncbi:MAG: HDOD domain-containing protein, partial [Desulfonatronovibrionaceae bacterium]
MKKVCCEHLLPGMKLAVDVKGADDSIFLARETVLCSDDIQGLSELGADWVRISSAGKDEDLKDLARRCEEYVRQFYYYVDPGSTLFNDLYRATLEVTMKRLMNEGDWVLPCDRELKAAAHQSRRDLFFQGEGGPEDIVNYEMELISFPDTYFKLREILKSPESSAANVAEVIRLDINLVTRLLRLVNSPAYGLPQKIDSVERAVAIIGVEGVSSLALGITAMPMFKDIPPDLMDVSSFWKHSISCAIFARDTARSMGR